MKGAVPDCAEKTGKFRFNKTAVERELATLENLGGRLLGQHVRRFGHRHAFGTDRLSGHGKGGGICRCGGFRHRLFLC